MCDTSRANAAFSVTLPDAAMVPGRSFLIVKISADANALTIATTNGQFIDGATSNTDIGASTTDRYIEVTSVGIGWLITGGGQFTP
jgi:hypothetical protein